MDERGVLDLDDDSKTENTRAAYKLEQIANALPGEACGPPELGRLPHRGRVRDPSADRAARRATRRCTGSSPASRPSSPGTEIGVTEPQPTFSACFGAPFLPQPPSVYARMLGAEARRASGRARVARQHGLDRRPVRRGAAHADQGDAHAPRRRALGRSRLRRVPRRSDLRPRGPRRGPGRRLARSSIRARRGPILSRTTRRRASSPRCSARTSRVSTTSNPASRRQAPGLTQSPRRSHDPVAMRIGAGILRPANENAHPTATRLAGGRREDTRWRES